MTTVLGIDPEVANPAYAVVNTDLFVLAFGTLTRTHGSGDRATINPDFEVEAIDLMKRWEPDMVAIETQYLGGNVLSAMQLVEVRGELTALARFSGLTVCGVNPSSWQSAILKASSRHNRAARKKMSIALARSLVGADCLKDDNVADAICIAVHAACRLKK